ncbi:MAG: hypothetical protein PHT79_01160 [Syntrophomonadaceae bacterium]|nr:hypothetical protein [Syntrophomonadaceae bacterium]MDD3889587.1 hypothetical protein [Syntrophomonadaceae bacterium]MDD4548359.1 hypothetical protein [Syntrophomonadaceae bacterium]
MGRSKSYENVTAQRFACMKAKGRSRVAHFARQNGYRLEKWDIPSGDSGTCRVVLRGNDRKKLVLSFTLKFKRMNNNQLRIEAIQMPTFISAGRAIAQVDSIYYSCK